MSSSIFTTKCADVIIPVGSQYSRIVQGEFETQDAQSILIIAPANASGEIPFQIQVCAKGQATETDLFSDLYDQQDNPVLAPTASKAKQYDFPAWGSWRIKSAAPVATATSFQVSKSHY